MQKFVFLSLRCLLVLCCATIPCLSAGLLAANEVQPSDKRPPKPNILWLFQEDLSPWIGCYGHEIQDGHTPTIDAMAARGVRFSRAFVPSPVCSTCRSGIIVGASQIRFGAHEHRSRRGEAVLPLPDGIKAVPELMKEAGYFCFNVGKTDYNFEHSTFYADIPKSNSKTPWRECPQGRPFFGQIQLKGGKLNTTKFKDKADRAKVTIPGDYPQNEMYREIVAEHYDSARMDDGIIGGILERLDADGLTESTIVVYFSDHGANNLVRHKQQPTEGGSHVPFIIVGPDPYVPAPGVRDDLVSMLDLSATTLAWAGIEIPDWVEGQNLFGTVVKPREFVATARDRCDHTIERIRSIRTDRFRYTRNYMLDRVLLQPQYRDSKPFVRFLRDAYAAGSLDPKLAEIYFGERPPEEFYDVVKDPAQLNNLVKDPDFQQELNRHRKLMDGWLAKGDMGAGQEPDIELEMASSKKWGMGVNAEYERIREDSDGDGLSDDWETINGRDPADGKLLFTFDCGGWQTEGWNGDGQAGNIAGRQGFLDFELGAATAILTRDGLQISTSKNQGPIAIQFRTDQPAKFSWYANDELQTSFEAKPNQEFQVKKSELLVLKNDAPIRSLQLKIDGKTGTKIEIDEIKISQ